MVIGKKLLVVFLATVSFGNIFGGQSAHEQSHKYNTKIFSKDEVGGKHTEYNKFPKDSDLLLDGPGGKVNFQPPSLADFPGMAAPVAAQKVSSSLKAQAGPRVLALDFDLTFLNVHCNGHPLTCKHVPILASDLPHYKQMLAELHKYFGAVVIVSRGIASETEQFLRNSGLFGPGLVKHVYGASDQAELNRSGTTYWPARKVSFLVELMKVNNITNNTDVYFYDDTPGNVTAAKVEFPHSYVVDLSRNGLSLLQDIATKMQGLAPVVNQAQPAQSLINIRPGYEVPEDSENSAGPGSHQEEVYAEYEAPDDL